MLALTAIPQQTIARISAYSTPVAPSMARPNWVKKSSVKNSEHVEFGRLGRLLK